LNRYSLEIKTIGNAWQCRHVDRKLFGLALGTRAGREWRAVRDRKKKGDYPWQSIRTSAVAQWLICRARPPPIR